MWMLIFWTVRLCLWKIYVSLVGKAYIKKDTWQKWLKTKWLRENCTHNSPHQLLTYILIIELHVSPSWPNIILVIQETECLSSPFIQVCFVLYTSSTKNNKYPRHLMPYIPTIRTKIKLLTDNPIKSHLWCHPHNIPMRFIYVWTISLRLKTED